MDKNIKIISVIVILVIVIIFIGVFYNKSSANTVKIGVLLPLSGSAAYYGEESKNGLFLAERDLEKKFPNIDFELVYEDSLYNPKGAVDGYQKLSTVDGVKAILVGGSHIAAPLVPLAQKDNILEIAVWAGAPSYTDKHSMNFRVTLLADEQVPPLFKYMQENNLKNLGILFAENEFGVAFKDVFKKLTGSQSINIVSEEGFSNTETDFRTQLAKIKANQPDTVFFVGTSVQLATALKQSEELDLNVKFLSTTSAEDPIITNMGSVAEGLVYNYNFDATAPESSGFVKDYVSQFNRIPTFYSAEAYVGLQLLAKAINGCKNEINPQCWKNYLENTKNIDTILGLGSFDGRGDFKAGKVILKAIRNGQFVKLEE
ncbi:MAG: Extracellular ligand-binding receptor [Parcubacteria group bacterium GW2011_GWA2_33_14]|uniref:Leucine-binding protein domain-containing protein n=1 Tax=Candidatus Staskawiczbacteria bacterium RIFCSPHIGHO2_02_FULL_33_16 TaxID=1802204 RepID=A0A1G2HSZ2_9BACT|nr:MAG: Extracellular ligand-binding receptor [Parcubacteria group bacterium GW2011_GWA2_33_14]OGZ65519.1 MAG: hypothetical protein A3D34_03815 [Candidatus Staskawiczbacteria bacterium RIFCSPHIGHO2_02_FULL_33_16]OGZ69946.1 MAG: hypothetical protein A2980_00460 [Candidatus Staskawiczbacteria bacterium RIFCSPLOWO2_01_FULL_33_13]